MKLLARDISPITDATPYAAQSPRQTGQRVGGSDCFLASRECSQSDIGTATRHWTAHRQCAGCFHCSDVMDAPPPREVSFILRLTAFHLGENNMNTIKVVGIDIAKSVFQVCIDG